MWGEKVYMSDRMIAGMYDKLEICYQKAVVWFGGFYMQNASDFLQKYSCMHSKNIQE